MAKKKEKSVDILKDIRGLLQNANNSSKTMIKLTLGQLILGVITLLAILGIGSFLLTQIGTAPNEYDYSLSVEPDWALLNFRDEKEFKVTIKNVGEKAFTDFKVYAIDICRYEGEYLSCIKITTPFLAEPKECGHKTANSGDSYLFRPGENCVITVPKYHLQRLFDDKTKRVELYLTIGSKPSLVDKKTEIKII